MVRYFHGKSPYKAEAGTGYEEYPHLSEYPRVIANPRR